ncbi:MAG: hypothetical protein OEZ30_00795 [Candidatus Aminicenantes bacterium]|nr:hypothetical protein [Candidatus Aminicenantes bacterium]MDH5714086.1 hypothetical protein [Candidatus Aminicenantes bacterium]
MEKKGTNQVPRTLLLVLLVFFLGLALTTHKEHFVPAQYADESTYRAAAESLAYDLDLQYTRDDLIRYSETWPPGPLGILLQTAPDDHSKLYYAKPFIYPLAGAILFRQLGENSLMLVNFLCFFLMIYLGYRFLLRQNKPLMALLIAGGYFLLSVFFVYNFWFHPEIFTAFLVFMGLFLWLREPSAEMKKSEEKGAIPGFLISLVAGERKDFLAAAFLAMATFSKVINVVFIGPLLITYALKRRFWHSFKIGVVFLVISGILFFISYLFTGNFNPYGGERNRFVTQYPFKYPNYTFDSLVSVTSTAKSGLVFAFEVMLRNLFYFFFGRFTGFIYYLFPGVLAIFYFMLNKNKGGAKISLLCFAFLYILITIVMIPTNYHGGGGCIGNRYFLTAYPAFFFLIGRVKEKKGLLIALGMAAVFLSPVLVNPLIASFRPGINATRFPYTALPLELTLTESLPTNVDPSRFGIRFPGYLMYFVDYNSWVEGSGFWVKGRARAEAICKTRDKISSLLVKVSNGRAENEVELFFGGQRVKLSLKPSETKKLVVDNPLPFVFRDALYYRVKIASLSGYIPRFAGEKDDNRFYGCHISFSIDETELAQYYAESQQWERALLYWRRELRLHPQDPFLVLNLATSLLNSGNLLQAEEYLERLGVMLSSFYKRLGQSIAQQTDSFQGVYRIDTEAARPTFRFEAEALQRNTGDVLEVEGSSGGKVANYKPGAHQLGYLIYGSFINLPRGEYVAKFTIKMVKEKEEKGEILIDVNAIKQPNQYQLNSKLIKARELPLASEGFQEYELPFSLYRETTVEFRVEVLSPLATWVDYIDLSPNYDSVVNSLLKASTKNEGETSN